MTPTVLLQFRSGGVLVKEPNDLGHFINKELLPTAKQMRQALNFKSIARVAPFLLSATAAFTTIWTSDDIGVGQVVRIDADVMATNPSVTSIAAVTKTALFFNDGTVQQDGATAVGYSQNTPGFGVQFLIVDNHVELQVNDTGIVATFTAVVTAQVLG